MENIQFVTPLSVSQAELQEFVESSWRALEL